MTTTIMVLGIAMVLEFVLMVIGLKYSEKSDEIGTPEYHEYMENVVYWESFCNQFYQF